MLNRVQQPSRRNALAKVARVIGAVACMAMSVFVVSPKPAEACFVLLTQIDDCNWVADQVCSYHNDGSGGYYVARSGIYQNC